MSGDKVARAARLKANPSLQPHGSVSTYSNWACRCDQCRDAWRAAFLDSIERRRARLLADPSLAEHGSPYTYTNWRCRCEPCKAAHAANRRNRRLRARQEVSQ